MREREKREKREEEERKGEKEREREVRERERAFCMDKLDRESEIKECVFLRTNLSRATP